MDMGKFLTTHYIKWRNRREADGIMGRNDNSLAQWTRWLNTNAKDAGDYDEIPLSNMSRWWNNDGPPEERYLHTLAVSLGPEVYDAAGVPRRMPDNELLWDVAKWLYSGATEEDQDKIRGIIGGNNKEKVTVKNQ